MADAAHNARTRSDTLTRRNTRKLASSGRGRASAGAIGVGRVREIKSRQVREPPGVSLSRDLAPLVESRGGRARSPVLTLLTPPGCTHRGRRGPRSARPRTPRGSRARPGRASTARAATPARGSTWRVDGQRSQRVRWCHGGGLYGGTAGPTRAQLCSGVQKRAVRKRQGAPSHRWSRRWPAVPPSGAASLTMRPC